MSKKKQLLIDTALSLFYKKGIHSVGINEILTVSGVAKKTLYRYFESKEILIHAVLEQRHQLFITWLEQQIKASTTEKEIVAALFNALARWFRNEDTTLGEFRGCFFINTSAEFSDLTNSADLANSEGSAITQYCKNHKQQVHQLISRYMPTSEPVLVDAICLLKEGCINAAYVAKDHKAIEQSINILDRLCVERN